MPRAPKPRPSPIANANAAMVSVSAVTNSAVSILSVLSASTTTNRLTRYRARRPSRAA